MTKWRIALIAVAALVTVLGVSVYLSYQRDIQLAYARLATGS